MINWKGCSVVHETILLLLFCSVKPNFLIVICIITQFSVKITNSFQNNHLILVMRLLNYYTFFIRNLTFFGPEVAFVYKKFSQEVLLCFVPCFDVIVVVFMKKQVKTRFHYLIYFKEKPSQTLTQKFSLTQMGYPSNFIQHKKLRERGKWMKVFF